MLDDPALKLMKRVNAGDQDACYQFYRIYRPIVACFIHRKLCGHYLTEDTILITLNEAIRNANHFTGGNLCGWVIKIAAHKSNDALRGPRGIIENNIHVVRLPEIEDGSQPDIALTDRAPGPEREAMAKEELARCCKAIRQLPRRQRDVITMVAKGKSSREISDELRIEEVTVRTALCRARDNVKKILAGKELRDEN